MLSLHLLIFVISMSRFCHCLEKETDIIEQTFLPPSEDGYYFRYVTGDGIERYEKGGLVPVDGNLILRVSGGYKYTGADGKVYSVTYTSGEKGYIVQNPEERNDEPLGDILEVEDERIGSSVIKSLVGGNYGK